MYCNDGIKFTMRKFRQTKADVNHACKEKSSDRSMRKIRLNVAWMALFIVVGTVRGQQPVTTFIFVRHAEKDMTQSTPDPDLSAEGRNRANRLAALFEKTELAAIFSTSFKRNWQTVEPLALQHQLPVQSYRADEFAEINRIFSTYAGKTVFICGHSNTVPAWVNYLMGTDSYTVFEDDEYGNIIVVSVTAPGKPGTVVWMKY